VAEQKLDSAFYFDKVERAKTVTQRHFASCSPEWGLGCSGAKNESTAIHAAERVRAACDRDTWRSTVGGTLQCRQGLSRHVTSCQPQPWTSLFNLEVSPLLHVGRDGAADHAEHAFLDIEAVGKPARDRLSTQRDMIFPLRFLQRGQ
jgi:hypothetical protein